MLLGFSAVNFGYYGLWSLKNFPLDFAAFYAGTRAALAGEPNPYEPEVVYRYEAATPGMPEGFKMAQLQPPPSLVLLVPYALLPFPVARAAWALTNLLLLVLSFRLLGKVVDPEGSDWRRGLALVAVMLNYQAIGQVLGLGQTPLIDLACYAGALGLWLRGRDLPAGLLLGLSALMKGNLALVVVFLVLLRPKAALGWLLAVAGGIVAGAVVFGPGIYHDYVTQFIGIREYHTASQTIGGFMQALYRLLARDQLDSYWHDYTLTQAALWWSPSLLVFALTAWLWRRADPASRPLGSFLALIPGTLLVGPFIFPRHMLPMVVYFAGLLHPTLQATLPRRGLWLAGLAFGLLALEYNWRPGYVGAKEILEYTKFAALVAAWLFTCLWAARRPTQPDE
jgi:hypothetical protein